MLLIAVMTGFWHFVFRDEFMALPCKTTGATGREQANRRGNGRLFETLILGLGGHMSSVDKKLGVFRSLAYVYAFLLVNLRLVVARLDTKGRSL